jgi:hypothetical protein
VTGVCRIFMQSLPDTKHHEEIPKYILNLITIHSSHSFTIIVVVSSGT